MIDKKTQHPYKNVSHKVYFPQGLTKVKFGTA